MAATQDLRTPPMCLANKVRRLNRLLTNAYERALADSGVTVSQFFILLAVDEADGTATAAGLAKAFDFERSTLSRTLARMADAGWIEEAARDGVNIRLRLTPAGRATYRAALPAWQAAQDAALARLGTGTAATLIAAVDMAREL